MYFLLLGNTDLLRQCAFDEVKIIENAQKNPL